MERYDVPRTKIIDDECECPFCNRRFKVSTSDCDDEANDHQCKRCGYHWSSTIDVPNKCPKCSSYSWNRDLMDCRCFVCNYSWVSRKSTGPARCPNCKSNRWNQPTCTLDIDVSDADVILTKEKWVMDRYKNGAGCVDIASELGLPLFRVMHIITAGLELDYMPRMVRDNRLY